MPSAESFYDSLQNLQCTTADYELVNRVPVKGGCKNGEVYCKIYLTSGLSKLLDTVCQNTDSIYEELGLDLGYYF